MKLTHLHVENTLGLRHLDLPIDRPVLLVAGGNGAGKTSLAQTIRLALTGEASRVNLKKEWGALVAEGAKVGFISVSGTHADPAIGDWQASMGLPSGKRAGEVPVHASDALPYALDMHRFSSLDDKEKRTYLFGLMGVSTSAGEIIGRLNSKGANADKVTGLSKTIALGVNVAEATAKENASRARGAWEAVTGERYGSQKAETWAPAQVTFDPAALALAEETLRAVDAEINGLNQQIGAARIVNSGIESKRSQLETLRAASNELPRRQELVGLAQRELDQFRPQVEALRAKASGAAAEPHQACPHCAGLVVIRNGAVQAYEKPETLRDADAVAQLPAYESSLQMLERTLANRTRDRDEAESAAKQVQELETYLESVEAQDIGALQQRVDALTDSNEAMRADRDAMLTAKNAAEAAKGAATKAAQHHLDVQEWSAIAAMLAPDGIPGEILAEALNPINRLLRTFAVDTGWMQVTVGADMAIRADGRLYALLSESEQWRTDAMLTVAIAKLSGLKLAVLDRFDVLEPAARPELIGWLDALAEDGDMDTVIALGTTKAAPSGMPESVQVHWLERNTADEQRQAA